MRRPLSRLIRAGGLPRVFGCLLQDAHMRLPRILQIFGLLFAVSHPSTLAAQSALREHIDAARLRVARDSFVVMMQGKPA